MRTMVNQGLINAALLRYAPGTYEVSSMPQVRAGHIRGDSSMPQVRAGHIRGLIHTQRPKSNKKNIYLT